MDAEERARRLGIMEGIVQATQAWALALGDIYLTRRQRGDDDHELWVEFEHAHDLYKRGLTRLRGMRAADLVDRGILDVHRELAISRDPSLESLIDGLLPDDPFPD